MLWKVKLEHTYMNVFNKEGFNLEIKENELFRDLK